MSCIQQVPLTVLAMIGIALAVSLLFAFGIWVGMRLANAIRSTRPFMVGDDWNEDPFGR